MTINVTMTKDEFLDYTKFLDYKAQIQIVHVDLTDIFNDLYRELIQDGIIKDKNKYDKLMNKFSTAIDKLKGGTNSANTEM